MLDPMKLQQKVLQTIMDELSSYGYENAAPMGVSVEVESGDEMDMDYEDEGNSEYMEDDDDEVGSKLREYMKKKKG